MSSSSSSPAARGDDLATWLPQLGQFALECTDVEATLAKAVEVLERVLPGRRIGIARRRRVGHAVMAAGRGPGGVAIGSSVAVEDVDPAQGRRASSWHVAEIRAGGRPWGWIMVGAPAPVAPGRHGDDTPGVGPAPVQQVTAAFLPVLSAALRRDLMERGRAAVAEFGHFALRTADAVQVLRRSVEVVAELLDVPMSAVIRRVGPMDRVRLEQGVGPLAVPVGTEFTIAPAILAAWDRDEPLQVLDWTVDPRFHGRPALFGDDVGSTLSAPILLMQQRWGRLLVADTEMHPYGDVEQDLLRSLADIASGALERWATDRAHSAIAALGRRAQVSTPLPELCAHALEVLTDVVDATCAWITTVTPGRQGHVPQVSVVAAHGLASIQAGQTLRALDAAPGEDPSATLHRHLSRSTEVVEDWALARDNPHAERANATGIGASVSVALAVERRPWGRFTVGWSGPRRIGETHVELATALAHTLTSVIERHRVSRRQESLVDFGRFALETCDLTATFDRALEAATGAADAPMASLLRWVDDVGPMLEAMARRGPVDTEIGELHPVPRRLVDTLRERHVLETLVLEDGERPVRHDGASAPRSVLSVNILVGGRSWGRLQVLDDQPRAFSTAEIDAVQALAHVLSSALWRAQDEMRLVQRARDLQRALLPPLLPQVDGADVAARYVPAGGEEVGGDWYDVFTLGDDNIAVVIGDVEGHDSTAAAVMGQVRTVVRTLAGEGHSPAEVIRRAGQQVAGFTERLVSCCYLELHPRQRFATVVSAGHPLPWRLPRDTSPEPLVAGTGLLMGVTTGTAYEERTVLLATHDILLLFTDGLVDDFASARWAPAALLRRMTQSRHQDIDVLADDLVETAGPVSALRDDAALVLVRLTDRSAKDPATEEPDSVPVRVERALRPDARAAAAARLFVRDVLTRWGLDDVADSAVLAVSELATNVILHTTSQMTLCLHLTSPTTVWIGVGDDSSRPATPHRTGDQDVGGRGLMIVALLADAWGVDPSPSGGKTVWLTLSTATRS